MSLQIAKSAPEPTPAIAPVPVPARKILGKRSRRVLRALAEVVAPRAPGLVVDPESLVDVADSICAEMPRFLQLLMPIGLLLIEFGTWFWAGTFRRCSRLDLARRERYVRGWVQSRWAMRRDLIKGVKGLILLGFYSDPRVMELIGYRPEPHGKLVAAERLVRHGHDL
jgi:hypothetical protein